MSLRSSIDHILDVDRCKVLSSRRLDISSHLLGRKHVEERERGDGSGEEVSDQVDVGPTPRPRYRRRKRATTTATGGCATPQRRPLTWAALGWGSGTEPSRTSRNRLIMKGSPVRVRASAHRKAPLSGGFLRRARSGASVRPSMPTGATSSVLDTGSAL